MELNLWMFDSMKMVYNFQKGDGKWMLDGKNLRAAVVVVKNSIPEILQTTPSGSTLKQQVKNMHNNFRMAL